MYTPFITSSQNITNQLIIIQRDDDPSFNVLLHFNHTTENYPFVCDFVVDKDVLLEKQNAE